MVGWGAVVVRLEEVDVVTELPGTVFLGRVAPSLSLTLSLTLGQKLDGSHRLACQWF